MLDFAPSRCRESYAREELRSRPQLATRLNAMRNRPIVGNRVAGRMTATFETTISKVRLKPRTRMDRVRGGLCAPQAASEYRHSDTRISSTAAVRRIVESAELLGSVFVAKSMIHIAPFQIPSKDHLSTI